MFRKDTNIRTSPYIRFTVSPLLVHTPRRRRQVVTLYAFAILATRTIGPARRFRCVSGPMEGGETAGWVGIFVEHCTTY